MTTEIIDAERTRKILKLRTLEKILDVTKDSARQHWAAWKTIWKEALYEVDGYSSWDDYCKKRWDVTGFTIERQISAAETFDKLAAQIVLADVDVPDSHMRAIAHFPADVQVEIYEQAKLTAPGKLTADHIEKTATRIVQEREEVAREKKRESLGAAPPPTPKPSKTAKKDTAPTEEDKITQAAAQHVITNAGPIKKLLEQAARWLRKGKRIFVTLCGWEIEAESVLTRDAERIEGLLDDLSAKDRKALGCAEEASAALGELREALTDKARLRERFEPALNVAETNVGNYRRRLAEILHEDK